MNYREHAVLFSHAGDEMLGIMTVPDNPLKTGVLIVVGGPQYRVGSHRQFLLLARALASAGYPVMRFDYRGMGDSSGNQRNFESVDADIAAAIDAFMAASSGLKSVVLWGLCDAASASLLYLHAHTDERLVGVILLNPWVRSISSLAKTQIKHYYYQRIFQTDFWRKLLTGKLGISRSLSGLILSVRNLCQQNGRLDQNSIFSFDKKMACGLESFRGQVLIFLSGNDYTAKEFLETVCADTIWGRCLKRSNVTQHEIQKADHTFSSAEWRGQVEKITLQWLDMRAGQ